MLQEKFDEISVKLDKVLEIHKSIPKWYPITIEFAKECEYETTDGLRKWCLRNLPPDDFVKRGKLWWISVNSLPYVNRKAT